jgi:RNA polymerase sigma factor (sigma-70 family)
MKRSRSVESWRLDIGFRGTGLMSEADNSLAPDAEGRTDIRQRVELAAEVFGKYGNEIRAMIAFNLKDRSRADDAFQNLFVSLVENPVPPHIKDVGAYLYRAVTNDVYDLFRRAKIHQESVEKYVEGRKCEVIQDDPQEYLIAKEERGKMFQLIENRLPKRQAAAVVHRYGHGLSTNDTAKRMHVDKKSVTRYLAAARKRLRKFIPQNGGNKK